MNIIGPNNIGAIIESQTNNNNYYHAQSQPHQLNCPALSVGESGASSNLMRLETVNNSNQKYINNNYHASNMPSSASGGEQFKANSHPTSSETSNDQNRIYTFPVIDNLEKTVINEDFAIANWKLQPAIHPLNKIKDANQENYEQLTKDLNDFIDDIRERAKFLARNEIATSFKCEEFTIDNHPIQSFDDVKKFLKSKQTRLAFEEDCIIP